MFKERPVFHVSQVVVVDDRPVHNDTSKFREYALTHNVSAVLSEPPKIHFRPQTKIHT
jgi:hypothetical protein